MAGEWIRPPALGPGATVGVAAPSGAVRPERLAAGLASLRAAGLNPVLSPACLARRHYLAGGDGERAAALSALLADPDIDGVLLARGGYGAMRLLPLLDLEPLRRRPKAVVGFSDATALHLALGACGLVSFHGPMVESGPAGMPPTDLEGLLWAVGRHAPPGRLPLPPGAAPVALHPGRATGRLVGGNLTLLAATLGTPWEVETTGCLLLLEDVGESPYRLDRSLTQLWLAGKLQAAAGFLLGELVGCAGGPGDPAPLQVFAERLRPLGRPCLAELPLGHGARRLTLPLGAMAELDAAAGEVRLTEPAVV